MSLVGSAKLRYALSVIDVLVTKNAQIQLRNKKELALQFLTPVLISLCFISLRFSSIQVNMQDLNQGLQYLPNVKPIIEFQNTTLVYTPQRNAMVESVMDFVARKSSIDDDGFRAFRNSFVTLESAQAVNDYAKKNKNVFAAICFDIEKKDDQGSSIPYSIRMHPENLPPTTVILDATPTGNLIAQKYIDSGFATLQHLVAQGIASYKSSSSEYLMAPATFMFRQFPSDSESPEFFSNFFSAIGPLYLITAFSPITSNMITHMMIEKELLIKESMEVMGLPVAAYWVSWLFSHTVLIECVILVTVGSSVFGGLYQKSSTILIFSFFSLFGLSKVAMSVLISTVFQKSKAANAFGSTFILMATLPSMLFTSSSSPGTRIFWSFLSPTAFGLGAKLIMNEELHGNGATWANFNEGNPSLLVYSVILVVDTFIYMSLAIFFDTYSWKDIVLVLRGLVQKVKRHAFENQSSDFVELDELVTNEQSDVSEETLSLRLENLRKIFPHSIFTSQDDTVAVDNLSFKLPVGSLLVMLGHNGAGKTTTISMLTGIQKPTSGKAFVNQRNIEHEMNAIREMTGMCPQKSIIWDKLTVLETLHIYAAIKNVHPDLVDPECNYYINTLQLTDKANSFCETLSGGMKRKLSVAIALLGNSKVVFLDEPTAGMDPSSRRAVWDLILKEKSNRTIILTTHLMDEADILGDQIGILVKGSLKCFGSPLELKSRYGSGYRLTCSTQEFFDPQAGLAFIQQKCQMSKLISHVTKEAKYQLFVEDVESFPALFESLEASKSELGIESFSISVTSLEEVFLKVLHEEESAISSNEFQAPIPLSPVDPNTASEAKNYDGISNSLKRTWVHTKLVFWKKRISTLRETKQLIHLISLPIQAAVMFLLLFLVGLYGQGDDVSLALTPKMFSNSPMRVPYCMQFQDSDIKHILSKISDLGVFFDEIICPDLSCSCFDSYIQEQSDLYSAVLFSALSDNPNIKLSTLLYNTTAIHSIPVTLNLVENAFIRQALKDDQFSIQTNNEPLPSEGVLQYEFMNAYMLSIYILMAISWIPGIIVAPTSAEKTSLSFQQQRISGLSPISYWIGTFAVDMCIYTFVACIIMVVLKIVGIKSINGDGASVVFLLLFLYGTSIIPLAYVFTLIFEKSSTANSILHFINSFSSFIPIFIVSTLEMTTSESAQNAAQIITYIFSIFPAFAVGSGLFHLELEYLDQIDSDRGEWSPWDMDVAGGKIVALLVDSLLFWSILFLVDYRILSSFVGKFMTPHERVNSTGRDRALEMDSIESNRDSDVVAEEDKVNAACNSGESIDDLTVQGVSKVYTNHEWFSDKAEFRALWNVNFSVPRGSCFGLLGPNGAGKSTLMNIISNTLAPSKGRILIKGEYVYESKVLKYPLLSSCPQTDPIFPQLSTMEHLIYYSHIRGLELSEQGKECNRIIDALQLRDARDKPASTLSGGTKRKLSLAISLLGSGSVILLDEPSSGVDPGVRRAMWEEIGYVSGRSVVLLTTHSMEECEALCSRVTILTNGLQQCIGGIQHLKSRFAVGFQMELMLPMTKVDEMKNIITSAFPSAKLLGSHGQKMRWEIPNQGASLSTLFSFVQRNTSAMQISDYSISQTTLDQIFLSFARQQLYNQPS